MLIYERSAGAESHFSATGDGEAVALCPDATSERFPVNFLGSGRDSVSRPPGWLSMLSSWETRAQEAARGWGRTGGRRPHVTPVVRRWPEPAGARVLTPPRRTDFTGMAGGGVEGLALLDTAKRSFQPTFLNSRDPGSQGRPSAEVSGLPGGGARSQGRGGLSWPDSRDKAGAVHVQPGASWAGWGVGVGS